MFLQLQYILKMVMVPSKTIELLGMIIFIVYY